MPVTGIGASAGTDSVVSLVTALNAATATVSAAALKAWALSVSFYFSGTPTTNTAGVITGGAITWPDGATGVYTATSTDSNGAVTAFTATTTGGTLGSKTVTVTVPRDSNSVVNGAMTVAVA